jgi:hypothetical protein
MMRTEAEITKAAELIGIALVMNSGDKNSTAKLEAMRDCLQWSLGLEGTKLGDRINRATAPALPPVAADVESALFNLGVGTRTKARAVAEQVAREMPTADFEAAFKRALTIARP